MFRLTASLVMALFVMASRLMSITYFCRDSKPCSYFAGCWHKASMTLPFRYPRIYFRRQWRRSEREESLRFWCCRHSLREKETAQATSVLARALLLAQPEGYIRIFLDEGEPLVRLLYQAKTQRLGRGYASELLSGLDRVASTDLSPAQLLIEPLTGRELEILSLIESGDSNQDIADRLVISIPTVKRHISNINAKLGAKNRTQAVSLARELGLLD
jgi:ATP/maltotriose-dependent transcriptional regulator MalT